MQYEIIIGTCTKMCHISTESTVTYWAKRIAENTREWVLVKWFKEPEDLNVLTSWGWLNPIDAKHNRHEISDSAPISWSTQPYTFH